MAENDIKTIVFDRIRHTLASMKMAASNAEGLFFLNLIYIITYLQLLNLLDIVHHYKYETFIDQYKKVFCIEF